MEIYNLIDAETLMRKGFTSEVMRSPELPKNGIFLKEMVVSGRFITLHLK